MKPKTNIEIDLEQADGFRKLPSGGKGMSRFRTTNADPDNSGQNFKPRTHKQPKGKKKRS